jgi:hypothetical protein
MASWDTDELTAIEAYAAGEIGEAEAQATIQAAEQRKRTWI